MTRKRTILRPHTGLGKARTLLLALLAGSVLIQARAQEGGRVPYVFHDAQDRPILSEIHGGELLQRQLLGTGSKAPAVALELGPGNGAKTIPLRKEHPTDPTEVPRSDRTFVLSDTEGQWDALVGLLRAGGVIDSGFHWSFGTGHLMVVGDLFDRGERVVETLWLLYALEAEARAAGGGVHIVLGNHEIMNLSGDHRYVHPIYFQHAKALGKDYGQLFDGQSELGRWLRSKNIIVKVEDDLFVHGGIAPEINRLEADLQEINEKARPHYAMARALPFSDTIANTVFGYRTSPFWYRGYFHDVPTDITGTINGTLKKFGAKHIIVGHTVVGDQVSTHYNHKVINVDTPHAEGKSGALLIEKGKYYRIDAKGKKELLW